MYNTHTHSTQHLSSYPPRPEQSYNDSKSPIEDDIIDSYSFSEAPSPMQTPYRNSQPLSPYQDPDAYEWPARPAPGYQHTFAKSRTEFTDPESVVSDRDGTVDFALPPSEEAVETRGFWDAILPESIACRLYVLTVVIETCIDVAVEADLFLRVRDLNGDLLTTRLPVYLGIFAFAHLFQLVMAIDAVNARNTLQFLFLTLFNALFLVYAVFQIFEIRQSLQSGTGSNTGGITDIPVNVLITSIPIVIAVSEIAYIALGWKIWREFGWKIYKRLGADRRVKRMYAHYQIFVCLIKFDLFFFIGFTIQLILFVLSKDWQYYVTCAALPFSFLLLVDGLLAARYENRFMMGTFMLGCIGAMVYFVYKLFRIVEIRDTIHGVVDSLSVFAVIAIGLLFVTFVLACIVLKNFGGGLKYHMAKPKHKPSVSLGRRGTEHQLRHQSYPLGFKPNRMSID